MARVEDRDAIPKRPASSNQRLCACRNQLSEPSPSSSHFRIGSKSVF